MTVPDHPYRPMIEKICLMTKPVPPEVIEAMMIVESNAVPSALSPSGAMGLLQIIYKYHAAAVDKAATDLGKRWGELALYDPEINLLAGTRILRWCYTSDGSQSWERAVRKYHSGSADPPADFKDGLGTTSDQHIAKFRAVYAEITGDTQEETPVAYEPKQLYWWLHENRSVNGVYLPGVTRYIHNRNGKKPKGIVHHVQEGWNFGSWQHFHSVKASSTVMIGRDGTIVWLVPEQHGPWTNGDVASPDALIQEMIRLYGPDPNEWTLTIEYEGFTGNLPYTEEQYQSGLWITKLWMSKYDITDIKRATIRHGQINSVSRYYCCEKPDGPFLTRLRKDLGASAPVPAPTPVTYAEPLPLSGMDDLYALVKKVGHPITVLDAKVKTIRKTPRYQTAGGSGRIGPDIEAGAVFDIMAEYTAGTTKWYVTPYWTRVKAADTERV